MVEWSDLPSFLHFTISAIVLFCHLFNITNINMTTTILDFILNNNF